MEAEAFKILEEQFPEEYKNAAYSLVLDQTGKFIEKHNLRKSNFPPRANSALYILALGLAKLNIIFNQQEAEKYLESQLVRIRDGGFDVVEEIFNEVMRL